MADQFDRALARILTIALQRGLARRRRARVRGGRPRVDVFAIDFSQPLPARETRLPRGLVPGMILAAVSLAALALTRLLRAG